jgi:hypothetical protein
MFTRTSIRIAIAATALVLGLAAGYIIGTRQTFDRQAVYDQGYQDGQGAK